MSKAGATSRSCRDLSLPIWYWIEPLHEALAYLNALGTEGRVDRSRGGP